MEKNEPGSVSRSVALPPSVWDLVDRAFPEAFASRSAYILELVKNDLSEKSGVVSSAISERRKSSVRGAARNDGQLSTDEVELFAQKIANEIQRRIKSGEMPYAPSLAITKGSIGAVVGEKTNQLVSRPPALSTHMPQDDAKEILKGEKAVPAQPASKKSKRNTA